MPTTVVTDDYVGCCICYRDRFGIANPKAYLPIPRTLFCTWGSWTGTLIWQNPSLPSWFTGGGCAYVPDSWMGVATIPFKYRRVGPYGDCDPTLIDTAAECVVAFGCYGYAQWAVRAVNTGACCLELDETQDSCAGGFCYCSGLPFGHCFTCEGEFSAALDGPTGWASVPFGCSFGVNLWSHNVCNLQTSNCYITE